ncbi:MAG TPA: shikimate dehydrogenase [Anaerolineales bacterium]|nr:shikimate dehydrogenase [Anaerolineales bacterium]
MIGYPLEHSLSPPIHQAALRALNLEGVYSLFPLIADQDLPQNLSALLARLRRGEIQGLNVTVPYKQVVIPYVDRLTPAAAAVGAVNTLYCQDQQLIGENTDVPGFLADLQSFLSDQKSQDTVQKHALVLGAGGSARAVVYALGSQGWQVRLAARRLAQAQELASDLHAQIERGHIERGYIEPISFDLEGLKAASKTAALLVNTTPVGMWPEVDRSPWPEGVPFPPQAFVYDLVYNPARTLFLKQAQLARLPISNGIGMLVEQAAQAFESWTKKYAPRKAMFAAVSEYLIDLI